jgi:prepilin-type N-terminal cleavage/methylation domain-containing protein
MNHIKQGVTLPEIVVAMLILAMAFIPLIGVIGTSSTDSDVANSVAFAQTAVRNILDTLLDQQPGR